MDPTSRFQTLTADNFPGLDTEEYRQQILQPLMDDRAALYAHFNAAITKKDSLKAYVLVDAFRIQNTVAATGLNPPVNFSNANEWTQQFSALFNQAMDQAALKSKVEAKLEKEIAAKEEKLRWYTGPNQTQHQKELDKLKEERESIITQRMTGLAKKRSIQVIDRVMDLELAKLDVKQLIQVTPADD